MDEELAQQLKRIDEKKARLDAARPLPPELERNLNDWYRVELTYTSNAIEGNTLSRQETALVIEKGTTIEGKTLREQIEAANHSKTIDFIKELILKKPSRKEIAEGDILDIHRIILTGIDDAQAGRYRSVAVRIAGAEVILPNPAKVPELMGEFMSWLHGPQEHRATVAADAHFKLVSIHPFVDGNGRTARLLMNLLLLQKNYPPAVIRPEDRRAYLNALEKGQTKGEMKEYSSIMFDAIERSLDNYLDAIEKSKGG